MINDIFVTLVSSSFTHEFVENREGWVRCELSERATHKMYRTRRPTVQMLVVTAWTARVYHVLLVIAVITRAEVIRVPQFTIVLIGLPCTWYDTSKYFLDTDWRNFHPQQLQLGCAVLILCVNCVDVLATRLVCTATAIQWDSDARPLVQQVCCACACVTLCVCVVCALDSELDAYVTAR